MMMTFILVLFLFKVFHIEFVFDHEFVSDDEFVADHEFVFDDEFFSMTTFCKLIPCVLMSVVFSIIMNCTRLGLISDASK